MDQDQSDEDQENLELAQVVARFQAIAAAEPNEIYDDSDSDSELGWRNSFDQDDLILRANNGFLTPKQLWLHQQSQQPKESRPYSFQPLRLLECPYNTKHWATGFPLARSGHRTIASNSHLYLLGGFNPYSALISLQRGRCLLYQELWSYNFATKRWKLELNLENARNMPVELASSALTILNNVLISHGGTGYPFGQSCSNDCYVYRPGDVAGETSTPGLDCLEVTGDLPTAQYGPGIVIHKNYLYTIGGTTGFGYSCDVYRLDLLTKVWENVYISRPEVRDDPGGRYRHEVVYDGHYIYILGGGASRSVYDLQRLPAYNLEANCWDYFDTYPDGRGIEAESNNRGFPKPRKCFSCVQHELSNGDIEAFITGGWQGDFSTYFSDIWKLNLRTKQWVRIVTASLPRPLYFHSAAHSDNGCMYIFGGIEKNENQLRRCNNLFKMWMTIPKLSEMCWDAITYYNDNLDLYDNQTLLKAGIPKSFNQRLPTERRSQQIKLKRGACPRHGNKIEYAE